MKPSDSPKNSGTTLVVCAWSGERRWVHPGFRQDAGYYVRSWVTSLSLLSHRLEAVLFVVPENECEPSAFKAALDDLPEKFGDATVDVLRTENAGISYGAWLRGFEHSPPTDYYLFMEDDWLFDIDDFDRRMIKIFDDLPRCAYLCGLFEKRKWPDRIRRLTISISNGLASRAVLDDLRKGDLWNACKGSLRPRGALNLLYDSEQGSRRRLKRLQENAQLDLQYSQYVFSLLFSDSHVADVGTNYSVGYRGHDGYRLYHGGQPLLMRAQ